MTTDEAQAALREEIQLVEQELDDLRRTVRELRGQFRDAGPSDPEERSAAITAADEQEALVSALEARRDRLRRRLGLDQD